MSKKKNKKIKSISKLSILTQQKQACITVIKNIEKAVLSLQRSIEQDKQNKIAIAEIVTSYKKNNMNHILSLNTTYLELKQKDKQFDIKEIENKLASLNQTLIHERIKFSDFDDEIAFQEKFSNHDEIKRNIERQIKKGKKKKETVKLDQQNQSIGQSPFIKKPQFIPLAILNTRANNLITIEPDWDNIGFGDGFITIKYKSSWYRKYIFQSKKFLNDIKHYYKFHNVPKLKVVLCGIEVLRIENEEVLFYHIDFLSIAATTFGLYKIEQFKISHWKKYTKQYYNQKLPFAFHTKTLKKLCEYCDPLLPIIPVGEVVLNNNGTGAIHNSFLFSLKSSDGYAIVWESVEESKASYIFMVKIFSDKEMQTLFDYITGDTSNKRWTLIHSKSLQTKLKMKNRILHTDFTQWDLEIKTLLRK